MTSKKKMSGISLPRLSSDPFSSAVPALHSKKSIPTAEHSDLFPQAQGRAGASGSSSHQRGAPNPSKRLHERQKQRHGKTCGMGLCRWRRCSRNTRRRSWPHWFVRSFKVGVPVIGNGAMACLYREILHPRAARSLRARALLSTSTRRCAGPFRGARGYTCSP